MPPPSATPAQAPGSLPGQAPGSPASASAGRSRTQRPQRADAARNRRALLAAARRVFERDGFVTARITDIADEAGLAHGSFYSHFRSKEDALAAVLGEVEEEMLHPGPSLAGTGTDPVAVIHAAKIGRASCRERV